MSERRVILLEQDDLMHQNTGESNYNETEIADWLAERGRCETPRPFSLRWAEFEDTALKHEAARSYWRRAAPVEMT